MSIPNQLQNQQHNPKNNSLICLSTYTVASGKHATEISTVFYETKFSGLLSAEVFFLSAKVFECRKCFQLKSDLLEDSQSQLCGSQSCHSLQPEGGIWDANKDEHNNMWWEIRIPAWIRPPVSLSSEMPSGQAEEAHVGVGENGRKKRDKRGKESVAIVDDLTSGKIFLTLNLGCVRSRWQIRAAAVCSVSIVEPLICPSSLALWPLLWGF